MRFFAVAGRRRYFAIAGLVIISLLAISGAVAAKRLCDEPLDVSGSTDIPDWLSTIKANEDLAQPAHAALAGALQRFDCSPGAIGLQWLKAASHARSVAEVQQAAEGVATAISRDGDVAVLAAHLCRVAAKQKDPELRIASLRAAGIRCSTIPALR